QIASVGSQAARAPEQYWKSALPNTPMPSSLSQLLNSQAGGTSVNVGSGGVHVDAGHGMPGGTTVDVGKGGVGVNVKPGSAKPRGTTVGVGKGGVGVNVKPGYGKPGGTTVGVGKGGVDVNVKPGSGKPSGTTVGVGKGGVGVNVKPGYGKPGGTTVGVGKGGVGVNVKPGGGTTVGVGKGGVGVNVKPGGGTTVGVGKGGVGVNVKPAYGKPGGTGTTVGVGKGGVGVNVKPGYGKPGGTTVGVGKGGVGVNVKPGYGKPGGKPRGKPVHVNVSPFLYNYAATETQLHDDPSAALFFLEKDLHAGKKMNVHFMATPGAGEKFLPRSEADAIPFSSEKAPEILSRFSVAPDSAEAAEMKQTLRECEATAAKGEKKSCATSLESMVDFATSSLGTSHVRAASTVVGKEGSPEQEYTMAGVRRAAGADQLVACHAEPYAYAVFACHLTQATRAYTVSMVGKDGTAVEAVAVCHADTAGWNPRHVAFQVLKVKPGGAPVCHFLPQDHVVWTRSG
uniref:BURP domain-containing protein n=1 Tax=Aegilops tauschii subsp. strangulata TaxID=200361 RepID=A0A453HW86_AEGTS